MQLTSRDLAHGEPIPAQFAFGQKDPQTHVALAPNRNPQLAWSQLPPGTQSLVITCIDPDAPTQPDDVNQEGKTVPADLPRAEFVHWLIADIPPSLEEIASGSVSDGVTPRGKTEPPGPAGSVQGSNDYTSWFAGDADMAGTYLGYDGPCPPWNDARVHRYQFTVYAVDQASLGLAPGFSLADLRQALDGHVLAEATLTGTYSLNPEVSA